MSDLMRVIRYLRKNGSTFHNGFDAEYKFKVYLFGYQIYLVGYRVFPSKDSAETMIKAEIGRSLWAYMDVKSSISVYNELIEKQIIQIKEDD